MMSLIQTTKVNGLDPKKYLEYLLNNLHKVEQQNTKNYNKLLLWNEEIITNFKVKTNSR